VNGKCQWWILNIDHWPSRLINRFFYYLYESKLAHALRARKTRTYSKTVPRNHGVGKYGALHEFLNKQNISDVAELSWNSEHEDQIISNLSIHRAVARSKILDFPTQKAGSSRSCLLHRTAELDALPAEWRTSFLGRLCPMQWLKNWSKHWTRKKGKLHFHYWLWRR